MSNVIEGELIEEGLAIDSPPETEMESEECHEQLYSAIDRLKDREREIIHQIHLNGATLAETARRIGRCLWTVEWHLQRAYRRLKIFLKSA